MTKKRNINLQYKIKMSTKKIESALVSVFHKDGLDEIIKSLHANGVKLISDNSNGGLTEEEIKFIEEKGYTVKFD